jgi:hypothetical protein
MNAKLSNFSELSNILSVKRSLRINLMALFTRFGLGHLLCKLSLEKEAGIPAVQLILSLCLFRIASESIHSMYKKSYYDLLSTGKNCYYRMMTRASMDWHKLQMDAPVVVRQQGVPTRLDRGADCSQQTC